MSCVFQPLCESSFRLFDLIKLVGTRFLTTLKNELMNHSQWLLVNPKSKINHQHYSRAI